MNKNGLLIWNVVLTLLVGWLLISKFSSKDKKTGSVEVTTRDTTGSSSDFKIAYFRMDSVAAKFEEAKLLKAELLKREEDNNNELNRLTKEFRDRYNYYQQKDQNGQMNDQQTLAASEEIKKMDENIKNRKAQMEQEYSDFYIRRQNEIKSKIENFIRDYNKTKKYSYVMSDDPGLFYFQDSTFDITSDVIRGLNKLYSAKKTKE